MALYVANCSKQSFIFSYRLPEVSHAIHSRIPPGSQIKISGSQQELIGIIKQHEPYGLKHVKDIENTASKFGKLAYQFDKPVQVDAILAGSVQINKDALAQSIEAQKITAVAIDKSFDETAQSLGVKPKDWLSVEIAEEEEGPGRTIKEVSSTIIEVEKQGIEPKSRGRKKAG